MKNKKMGRKEKIRGGMNAADSASWQGGYPSTVSNIIVIIFGISNEGRYQRFITPE